jgi:hypothetical protein
MTNTFKTQLDIYLTDKFIHAKNLPICPLIDRQGYFLFLFECIYYVDVLFTEITCTRMSLNLTEGINVMKNTDRYNYREMVTMSCKSGFTCTSVTSRCTDVNKWSHKSPTCTSKTLLSAISTPNQWKGKLSTHH